LNVAAGAGGVVLTGDSTFNQLILFPSPQGSLTINTLNGGSLTGSLPAISGAPQIFNLIVSDSSRSQCNSSSSGYFGLNDHAAMPVHLNSEMPINLNIAGDMNLVLLGAPEAAQITVAGNMNNSRFQGMNLAAADVTSITVAGDINNGGAFTSVNLSQVAGAQPPDLSVLPYAIGSNPSAATLAASFYYDPATQLLTYQNIPGTSLASVLQQLQNLTIQIYSNGIPQWADPPNNTVPRTTVVSVLNAADANALLALYNALGAAPSGAIGYSIGGGGQFNISARNLDLGTSTGINSLGVGLYAVSGIGYPLANYFTRGADISVNLSGTLTMYSSAIASFNSGNIHINAEGDINIGSEDYSITSLGNRGIYSGAPGDISVFADGDIIVNGSRIAAYDGGNITVESLTGNVDAGTGGMGYVNAGFFKVNPATHQVTAFSPVIPGNGIMATTFPTDAETIGNIGILAAQDILLGCNAITQTPLNGTSGSASTITLQAGGNISNNGGCAAVIGAGTVNITADGVIYGVIVGSPLNAQVNGTNLAAVAGTNVQFTVAAGGLAPFSYQWFKDGTSLPGETDASLFLTDINRAAAGTYSVVVSNVTGTVTNDIQLHILVPQLLSTFFVQTNQIMSVSFGDADGGLLTAQDIPSFVIQTSTNLVDWTSIDLPISTNASGGLSFQLPSFSDPGCGFYRILSQ
jgi:hypothetical protein